MSYLSSDRLGTRGARRVRNVLITIRASVIREYNLLLSAIENDGVTSNSCTLLKSGATNGWDGVVKDAGRDELSMIRPLIFIFGVVH